MATTTTSTSPFLKTLSISITTTTTTKTASIFNPKSLFFKKPTKNFSLSLQKPIFFTSPFITQVAQTSEWDQDSSPNAAVLDEEPAVGLNSEDVSEPVASGFGTEGQGLGGGNEGFPEPSEDTKLFVGNLPFDVDSEKLAGMFDAAGVVEVAEEVNGSLLTVSKAAPKGSHPEFAPSFRIYVGNLPWDVDNDRLEELFSEHGKVLTAHVVSDRETGLSRGFAFVNMASESEMNDAITALDGQTMNGRTIWVNVAEERSRPEFAPFFRIYVGNIPWDVDDDRLEELFSEHGKVLTARVVSDRETGRSRGFAFVTMASESEMNDAITALDGQTMNGRTIWVSVAEERPRRTF